MNANHTPTPWVLNAPDITTADGAIILHTLASSSQRGLDNARFIVRAVNSHEALLEAAKEARNVLSAPVYMHIKKALDDAITNAEVKP